MIYARPLLAGFNMQTLYTTIEETYLKFKLCFGPSSIGASLTEDDVLERYISYKASKASKAKSEARRKDFSRI